MRQHYFRLSDAIILDETGWIEMGVTERDRYTSTHSQLQKQPVSAVTSWWSRAWLCYQNVSAIFTESLKHAYIQFNDILLEIKGYALMRYLNDTAGGKLLHTVGAASDKRRDY